MSRIDELIAEYCPDGVEYRALGEVGEFIRGSGLQKKDLFDEGVPAIHYGQIHTHYGTWATKTKSFTTAEIATRLRRARTGDLLIATTSEDDEAVAKATAWLGHPEVVVSGDAFIYRHELEPRYVSYYFQTDSFQKQKRRHITGTKVRRISAGALADIRIPVPPLRVQQEIVRILDQFTELEAELKAELKAELEARRKQYDHYQSELFSELDDRGALMVPLCDAGRWFGGGTPHKGNSSYWNNGTIPWVSPKDMGEPTITATKDRITERAIKGSSAKLVPAHSVAVVVRSSILDHTLPIAYLPMEVALNQDMKAVQTRPDILSRFLFFALQSRRADILHSVRRRGGSVASLDSRKLMGFEIPVPPLDEQHRIVAILDEFDALVTDISVGLPAELSARRKQYEYYRDKLLTFKERL